MIKQVDEAWFCEVCVINLMDKQALIGLVVGGIAIASAIIWMTFVQEISISFEMLEP